MRLWDQIRMDEELAHLDPELITGWVTKEPPLPEPGSPAYRRSIYICQSILQLMENVYLELQLETEWNHIDNQGWARLFRHWAESGMVKETYRMAGETYGIRFRQFCKRRLNLG